MKKLFLLLATVVFAVSAYAQQEIVAVWTFDNQTGNNSGASNTAKVVASNSEWASGTLYADGTHGSDDFHNGSSPEINAFNGTTINDPRETPNKSKDLALVGQNANGKSVVFTFPMTGKQNLQLTFAVKFSTKGFKSYTFSYSTDGEDFTELETFLCDTTNTDYHLADMVDFSSATELNEADMVYIKLTVNGAISSQGNNRFDNMVFMATPAGPDIYPPVISSHAVVNDTTIKLNFNEPVSATTAGALENYTMEGFSFTSATMNGNALSLNFTPELVEGESYNLYVSNIEDIEGNVMAPDTISFTYGVSPEFIVANIAELRAKWTADLDQDGMHFGNEVYKLTGSVIVTAINDSYRNQVYIQDSTGAIVIDDSYDRIKTTLVVGDEIKNIYGTLSDYYGHLQFAITEDFTDEAISVYNPIEPLTVTVSNLQDYDFMNAHQSEYITIKNVNINGTGVFENGGKYTLTQEGVTGNGLWIHFYDMPNLTGAEIPTEAVNITGVNKITHNAYYIIPRHADDIVVPVGIENYLTEKDIVIYPNPASSTLSFSLNNNNFQVSKVIIYDISGKLVTSKSVNNNNLKFNIENFAAGQYFVRLSDGKHSVTTKFIKK